MRKRLWSPENTDVILSLFESRVQVLECRRRTLWFCFWDDVQRDTPGVRLLVPFEGHVARNEDVSASIDKHLKPGRTGATREQKRDLTACSPVQFRKSFADPFFGLLEWRVDVECLIAASDPTRILREPVERWVRWTRVEAGQLQLKNVAHVVVQGVWCLRVLVSVVRRGRLRPSHAFSETNAKFSGVEHLRKFELAEHCAERFNSSTHYVLPVVLSFDSYVGSGYAFLLFGFCHADPNSAV